MESCLQICLQGDSQSWQSVYTGSLSPVKELSIQRDWKLKTAANSFRSKRHRVKWLGLSWSDPTYAMTSDGPRLMSLLTAQPIPPPAALWQRGQVWFRLKFCMIYRLVYRPQLYLLDRMSLNRMSLFYASTTSLDLQTGSNFFSYRTSCINLIVRSQGASVFHMLTVSRQLC